MLRPFFVSIPSISPIAPHMPLDKRTKLDLIEKYPEFILECMTFGAEHLLHFLRDKNAIKPINGKRPNRANVHPMILQQFKRNIEITIDVSEPKH
jgi:hypothetical protein